MGGEMRRGQEGAVEAGDAELLAAAIEEVQAEVLMTEDAGRVEEPLDESGGEDDGGGNEGSREDDDGVAQVSEEDDGGSNEGREELPDGYGTAQEPEL